jgi:hypothetical protein
MIREDGNTVARLTHFDRLIRIGSRLSHVPIGSVAADQAIHDALGRTGPVLPYTTDQGAARSLLPPGFEWMPAVYASRCVYGACRRAGLDGEWPYPHHGQWSAALPLAMCGAVLRAWAKLAKG